MHPTDLDPAPGVDFALTGEEKPKHKRTPRPIQLLNHGQQLLDTHAATTYTGLSRKTLERAYRDGLLNRVKIVRPGNVSGVVRYRVADLDQFIGLHG